MLRANETAAITSAAPVHWMISAGRLWLMAPAAQADGAPASRARPAARSGPAAVQAGLRALPAAELRAAIAAAAQQALDHTRAVLEAAAA